MPLGKCNDCGGSKHPFAQYEWNGKPLLRNAKCPVHKTPLLRTTQSKLAKCISVPGWRLAPLLLLALVACTETQIVYVYPDAAPGDAAAAPDAADGATPVLDAGALPEGTCVPDRVPGTVTHTDCRPYAATPICDAIWQDCVGQPTGYCDPCETDEQCHAGFDVRASCVVIPGAPRAYQACLSPCVTSDDCITLGVAYAQCSDFPAGRFCLSSPGDPLDPPRCYRPR